MTTDSERAILERLDRLLRKPSVRSVIDRIADDAVARLASASDEEMTWAPVPLDTYEGELPGEIRSSWVFVLRRQITLTAHRHPNSVQRMMSYSGSADFPTRTDGEWISHELTSDPAAPLLSRWLTIPENVWHRGVMGDHDWVVVSFHTAAEDELMEEEYDPDTGEGAGQRTYSE